MPTILHCLRHLARPRRPLDLTARRPVPAVAVSPTRPLLYFGSLPVRDA